MKSENAELKNKGSIRCVACRFVREDRSMSEKVWKAYECGNAKSEYYRCLLNININGGRLSEVVWKGCGCGEKKWCCK